MRIDIQKYKSFALMQLKGRWRTAILGTLIALVIITLFSVTQNQTSTVSISDAMNLSAEELLEYTKSQYSAPSVILSFIQTIVSFIIDIVLASFFLIFSRSPDPVSMKSYFDGFNKWGRGILCGLWKLLWTFLWGLIAIPICVGFTILIALTGDLFSDGVLLLLLTIVMIIGFIPMFIKLIEYSFAVYFTAEFPELGIRKALRLSISIAKGHRWEIFVLDLSFIGWFLLGCITFCIGLLWIIPYYEMTFINTYHALLQDALETGKIKPEDLN